MKHEVEKLFEELRDLSAKYVKEIQGDEGKEASLFCVATCGEKISSRGGGDTNRIAESLAIAMANRPELLGILLTSIKNFLLKKEWGSDKEFVEETIRRVMANGGEGKES